MAKLRVAYGLCPLIDQSSLLGVSDDSVQECVIVTIGKNIVIRYRFQDQKQVGSWSSKDKLTSAVIYDPVGSRYAAVFNYNQLRLWKESDEQLDKVKKFKFEESIHCIIPQLDGDPTVVLFRNGCVALLDAAVESRKESISGPILRQDEVIVEFYCISNTGRKYITFITRDAKDAYMLNVVPIILGESPLRYSLHRDDCAGIHLIGQTVLQADNSCSILTLWSDGQLFSFTFLPEALENFPGHALHVITALCVKNPVQMVALKDRHLALFGADPGEEGASLLLFDLQFMLVQSRLHFKLYSKPPRLFKVGTNLLVAQGNSLVVVPYQLETERLASLVGAHSSHPSTEHVVWFNNAEEDIEVVKLVPSEIQEQVTGLRNSGLSEAAIAQVVLPQLIKKKQITCLTWCMQNFDDIPEKCLAEVLIFCLSETQDTLESQTELLLEVLLSVHFNEAELVPHIRSMPFSLVLELLQHLWSLVRSQGAVPCERVLEWISLLLGAHYQQYLLSRDPQVLALLSKLRHIVNEQLNFTEELKRLAPLMTRVQARQPPVESHGGDQRYTIELLQLY